MNLFLANLDMRSVAILGLSVTMLRLSVGYDEAVRSYDKKIDSFTG